MENNNNNNNYGILANLVIINMIIAMGYYSNIKALLEVYNFPYKSELLPLINEIDLDTNSLNEYFNDFKKNYFIKNHKEESNIHVEPVKPSQLQKEQSHTSELIPAQEHQQETIPVNSLEESLLPKEPVINKDEQTVFEVKKIMIAGDSVAQSLEFGLQQLFPKKIENRARHSTGLTVPTYFDWEKGLKEYLADSVEANVLIFMVGANDAQDFYLNKKFYSFGSPEWNAEYKSRVNKILDTMKDFNHIQKIIWIGQPIMKSPNFDKKMQVLNSIYAEAIQERNDKRLLFVPTRELLSVNGEYSAEIDKKLSRASDGIHLGMHGTEIIAAKIKELLY